MNTKHRIAIFQAILAAVLYAISSPISKILLQGIPPMMMASLLYLGAGLGMSLIWFTRLKTRRHSKELKLTRKELPYTLAMILLDIAAPILLLFGLKLTTAANASLLNNFEVVATAIVALAAFKEKINKRLWVSIILITISSIILTIDDHSSFSFSLGSILVLLACMCWAVENNCTRVLSSKDPLQIVVVKGFGSGLGALIISLSVSERIVNYSYLPIALVLGFVAYGLSIFFYVYAQRELGAAKTSAYYAIAPFVGVALSFLFLAERPNIAFIVALSIMIVGAYLASTSTKKERTQ